MFGFNTLMEAMNKSAAEQAFDPIFEAATELDDDDVKELFIGGDSVEDDMDGNGISDADEARYEELLKKIPVDGEELEDDIEELTESFFMTA